MTPVHQFKLIFSMKKHMGLYNYMGYSQQFFFCVCVGGWLGRGGRGRWGEREVGGEGSLNENSSKREVFRLFIFRIVSPLNKLALFY